MSTVLFSRMKVCVSPVADAPRRERGRSLRTADGSFDRFRCRRDGVGGDDVRGVGVGIAQKVGERDGGEGVRVGFARLVELDHRVACAEVVGAAVDSKQ
jgi:hypothetical protein